ALRELHGLRRVLVGERPRGAEEGGRVLRIVLQRHLIRAQRLGLVVLLEKQIAPRGLDFWVRSRRHRAVSERRVGFLRTTERAERTRRARELDRIVARLRECGDLRERRARIFPEQVLEQTELQRGLARRRALRRGAQQHLRVGVAAGRDERARPQRDAGRILRVELLGERLDLAVAPFDERALRRLHRRHRAARRLRGTRGRQREDRERTREHGEPRKRHDDSYYRLRPSARSSTAMRLFNRTPKIRTAAGPATHEPVISAAPTSSPATAT